MASFAKGVSKNEHLERIVVVFWFLCLPSRRPGMDRVGGLWCELVRWTLSRVWAGSVYCQAFLPCRAGRARHQLVGGPTIGRVGQGQRPREGNSVGGWSCVGRAVVGVEQALVENSMQRMSGPALSSIK